MWTAIDQLRLLFLGLGIGTTAALLMLLLGLAGVLLDRKD